jgi:MFS family permease
MLFRFCLYGFLKNQRYFEPFLMLVFLDHGFSFLLIGLLLSLRDLTVNVLEIPSGAIADSFGRRGAMVVSFVAYIISFLVLGLADSIELFFLGMFLFGIGDTFRTGTHKSMIFEWLRLQDRTAERTAVYGITRSWSQIGAAVSGIIAAGFVLVSGNYESVFLFATIPYLVNLVNLWTYPASLDGDHEKATTLAESVGRLKVSIFKSISKPQLRGLMLESMGWEGVFNAVKDYLQPVLHIVAISAVAFWFSHSVESAPADAIPHYDAATASSSSLNEAQTAALLIGPVYAILFLLSAWGSRNAHRLVEQQGDEAAASRRLWRWNFITFALIAIAGWFEANLALILGFTVLFVLKNIWRPILITRFDSESESAEGATVLSIESQSQRVSTMILAPLIGWSLDFVRHHQIGGEFWPIGAVGAVVAGLVMIWGRMEKVCHSEQGAAP